MSNNTQLDANTTSGDSITTLDLSSFSAYPSTGKLQAVCLYVGTATSGAPTPVANANPIPVGDAGGTLTVDAPVGTPVFVRLSDGSSAISTLPVSLASVPSHAVTNVGTFAVQIDGAALTSLQLIDDAVGQNGIAIPGKGVMAYAQNLAGACVPLLVETTAQALAVGGPAAHDAAAAGYPILLGAEFDDTLPDSVDEGDVGRLRISSRRELYVQIRDAAGNERGLNIDASGNLGVGTHAVTQSGTWNVGTVTTVTSITNAVAVTDNSGSLTVDAPVGTPVFVRLSDGSSAISTLPVSLASVPSHAVTNAGTFTVQSTLQTGDNTAGRFKLTDGTDVADVLDLTNSNPLTVAIVDGSGDQITSFGGGTQYTEGDTDASITGTAVMWEDGSNTLRAASAAKPLPVEIIAGGGTGGTSAADDADFTAGTTAGTPAMGVYESTPTSVTDGDLGTVGITQGRRLKTSATIDAALPAGTNAIGKLAANSGVDIGDVDVTSVGGNVTVVQGTASSLNATVVGTGTFAVQVDGAALTALQLIDDPVFADDAAFTPGSSKVFAVGCQADEASTDSVDEGDVGCPRMTLDRKLVVTTKPVATGEGCDVFRSLDIDETEEDVKTSAGMLYGYYFANLASSVRYLKFYNLTAANTTVGSSTPLLTLPLPATSAGHIAFPSPIKFDTALCAAATTGVADADTGAPSANDVVLNVFYK